MRRQAIIFISTRRTSGATPRMWGNGRRRKLGALPGLPMKLLPASAFPCGRRTKLKRTAISISIGRTSAGMSSHIFTLSVARRRAAMRSWNSWLSGNIRLGLHNDNVQIFGASLVSVGGKQKRTLSKEAVFYKYCRKPPLFILNLHDRIGLYTLLAQL